MTCDVNNRHDCHFIDGFCADFCGEKLTALLSDTLTLHSITSPAEEELLLIKTVYLIFSLDSVAVHQLFKAFNMYSEIPGFQSCHTLTLHFVWLLNFNVTVTAQTLAYPAVR